MIGGNRLKTLIIYKSIHGLTKEYAEWMQANYEMDIVPDEEVTAETFDNYDVILFGCCVRFMKLPIEETILKYWEKIKNKDIVLFSTSGMKKEHPMAMMPFYDSFEPKVRKKIKFYPLNGRLRQNEITPQEHIKVSEVENNLNKIIKEGGETVEDYKVLLDVLKMNIDHYDVEQLKDIIEYLKTLEEKYDDGDVFYF